eukprot:5783422-Ditylum_brightwellii.AAC.1
MRAEEEERSRRQYETACQANAFRILWRYFGALRQWVVLQKQHSDKEERFKMLFEKASRVDTLRLLKLAFEGLVQAKNLSATTVQIDEVDDEAEIVDLELERLEKESKMFSFEDHRAWQYRAFSNKLHCRNITGDPFEYRYSFFGPTGFHKVLNTLYDLRFQGDKLTEPSKKVRKRGISKKINRKYTAMRDDTIFLTSSFEINVVEKDTQSENDENVQLDATNEPKPE